MREGTRRQKLTPGKSVFFSGVFFAIIVGALWIGVSHSSAQVVTDQNRSQLTAQLDALQKEADLMDASLQQTQASARTLANEVKTLDTEVKRRELEIRRLTLAIRKATLDIEDKTQKIAVLSAKIDKSRSALASSLFLFATYDQDNVLTILLKNNSLSEFFGSVNNLEKVQGHVHDALLVFKDDRETREKEKADLEGFQEEQQNLKALQEVERKFLAQKKQEKDDILRLTRGKEALFQQLLRSKQHDIASLKTQLFYLEKTGITAEDAVRAATVAAKRAGIRPAFLLALLEVETGKQFEDGVISVGTNLGTGSWERDMYNCYIRLGKRTAAENEKTAFFSITSGLGLDPDTMPVSRKPSYGCGGAMGPAQFLPTTWLRFDDRVATLTGHTPPNPWNTEDAFTAAAIFLADAGADAQTSVGETMAAKTYISGNPSCTKYVCRSYSSRIVALARDIDRIL